MRGLTSTATRDRWLGSGFRGASPVLAMLHEYEPVFSANAWEVLLASSKRRQAKIATLAYALADAPFQVGDYQSSDSTGRLLENLRIEGYIFTYWPDHGSKELRIVDLVEL